MIRSLIPHLLMAVLKSMPCREQERAKMCALLIGMWLTKASVRKAHLPCGCLHMVQGLSTLLLPAGHAFVHAWELI